MNISDLKEQLDALNTEQKTAFNTVDVMTLLHQRSHFYDQLLQTLWKHFSLDKQSDLALIAVGGYGRQEMFPLSDLDILVISERPIDKTTQDKITQLFNILWDCNLQLGSAIRSIQQCIEIGLNELSVATNMFESRFLVGNKSLWEQLISRLYQDDFWAVLAFFQAKIEEKQTRYERYHNTSYNLEPDLKHSPGGLRDLHLLSWIMLRQYGVQSLDALYSKGILFQKEYEELKEAQQILFQMRFGLHLQLKRYDNRLRFDRQLALSEQLGYQGEGNHPVEMMMKAYFQATQSISQLSQLILDNFNQDVLNPLQNKGTKLPLDELFFLRDNQISCYSPRNLSQAPEKILDLFYYLTKYPEASVAITTLRHLRLTIKNIETPLCENPKARHRFIQIFTQPHCIQRAILPMHRFGVLSIYLPQWKNIRGLMQFDMFHLYTVDEHIVRVMQKLESFLDQTNSEKHPLCCEIFPILEKRPLLYLAALFHDIAKGRNGDHSKLGAEDILQFAHLHEFSEEDGRYMAWLVEQHLAMSITAQRRDIHDPVVIKNFANLVNNPTALSALTCLTVADICATNETLWNDWKRSLIRKLYQFTLEQLNLGKEESIDYHQLALENRNQTLQQLNFSEIQQQKLNEFWDSCPESYFVRHNPTQLIWHATSFIHNDTLPLVLVSNQYARSATEIFIYTQEKPYIFARVAQMMSQKKVTVHDAQILTSDNGFILDSFIISEQNGKALSKDRLKQIQLALSKTLQHTESKPIKIVKKPIKHRSFKRKTMIRFLDELNPSQTAFELFTLDREGLLAQIGYIFQQLQLNLINAKITTIGERVEDFFVVTTSQNHALSEEQKQQLKQAIIAELTN
ncbi:bifunctional uridylyltransferase/uridylyl-removing protein GlnD [Otariodibacter oris]|uniref:Bifunctional uridylyltransferase/uridylyl-removing enzyme n=1 Tax=Otariodibacter oris TaxID=1032623 RepID=A0A420XIN2_9PAST|nr:bifunctional uridylyltransferase/uridylyl-removing protein GlnD [Otariodibacter oris]QGM80739.1 protein-P-II uridylyltransferase [Otariodibacter oris]RKR77096.1 UTP--GlnB (protein PII) uridylyltransferase GlnD [Otariodibacter oris]